MNWKWGLFLLLVFSIPCMNVPAAYAQKERLLSEVLNYAGKTYGDAQDPEYVTYDQALREYMVKRIKQRFGIELDPKKYSGFDLLEIESFFECKKSDEPFDLFLAMFPRQR
jgi:hypothetical protein